MVGNVNNIVESMYAADNARSYRQAAAASNTETFSDYLDLALLNGRTGLLTGGLSSDYSYRSILSGSIWQTAVLEALRDGLKKNGTEADTKGGQAQGEATAARLSEEKKTDWARIRVIRRYQVPVETAMEEKKGILV